MSLKHFYWFFQWDGISPKTIMTYMFFFYLVCSGGSSQLYLFEIQTVLQNPLIGYIDQLPGRMLFSIFESSSFFLNRLETHFFVIASPMEVIKNKKWFLNMKNWIFLNFLYPHWHWSPNLVPMKYQSFYMQTSKTWTHQEVSLLNRA